VLEWSLLVGSQVLREELLPGVTVMGEHLEYRQEIDLH
jgi:hypothetical protein